MIEPIEDLEVEFIRFAEEFGGYLEDFKRRLLLCAVLFIAAFMAGFFCSPVLIRSLVDLLALTGVEYVVTSPFEVLSMSVNIGLFLAISSVFPLILVEIYEFVRPALQRQVSRKTPSPHGRQSRSA
jgi:Sec-independent protein secretion pathway component TatC